MRAWIVRPAYSQNPPGPSGIGRALPATRFESAFEMKYDYTKLIRRCETWFSKEAKVWMCDKSRTAIESYLDENGGFPAVLGAISRLAAWAARLGCVAIGKGDSATGWAEMKRYCAYELQLLTYQSEATRLRGHAPFDADPTWSPFHLLGLSQAFRDWENAAWLGEIVVESRTKRLLGHRWASERRDPFRCYLAELYGRNAGKASFPDNFGPYARIFAAWEGGPELEKAIRQACDYHVGEIELSDPEDIAIFESNPFELLPSEIIALYRVREKLGLATPSVNHPLLMTPFSLIPENPTYVPDALVVDAFRMLFQKLPDRYRKHT